MTLRAILIFLTSLDEVFMAGNKDDVLSLDSGEEGLGFPVLNR